MAQAPYVGQPGVDFRKELAREAAIGRLAERQHGVVSLGQLQLAGLGKAAVARRAKEGRLVRIHRAVYAVGHAPLTAHGRWMAAVLACGPRAVLSHRSAGALLGIRPSARAGIDVTVPARSARGRHGIVVHASVSLRDCDVTVCEGIPCTGVARTLLDLAGLLDRRGIEKAVDQAEMLRLFDLRAVEDVLERAGPRRGAGLLREVLAAWRRPTLTRRDLEERFLAICRAAGVPEPLVNQWMVLPDRQVQADFLWPAERLVIETDGWETHGTRAAFVRDRSRDRALRLAGYETYRFTWDDVTDRPEEVTRTLRELLAKVGGRGRRAA